MAFRFSALLLLLCCTACGIVRKKTSYSEARKVRVEASDKAGTPAEEVPRGTSVPFSGRAGEVISTALTYTGVRYKYGGTDRRGMDCSGLLYVAFGAHDVPLPRISHQMAEEGTRIRVNEVERGDLLFFKTQSGSRINHVGLVVDVEGDEIRFIHSTSSRGVIVSSLREGFWNYAFVKATRIL